MGNHAPSKGPPVSILGERIDVGGCAPGRLGMDRPGRRGVAPGAVL